MFSKVESIKELGDITIAMTDYGFWDIEPNTTNNITYSFRSEGKGVDTISTSYDIRPDKIIRPKETDLTDFIIANEYQRVWKIQDVSSSY